MAKALVSCRSNLPASFGQISPLADASHNIGNSGQVFACVPTKETLGRKLPMLCRIEVLKGEVNGYSCKDFNDVGYAEKHIDPVHPQSGPCNVNAEIDPRRWNNSVTFGGRLTAIERGASQTQNPIGGLIDILT